MLRNFRDALSGRHTRIGEQIGQFSIKWLRILTAQKLEAARQADTSWILRSYQGEDARVLVPSIEGELHLGTIYAGVMDEPA